MKTAISIPDDLFEKADRLARRLGKSRSELVTDALREHVRLHGDAALTARLNAVYGDDRLSDENRAALAAMAVETAERNPW